MPSDSSLFFDDGWITHEYKLLSSSQADYVMSIIGDYNEIVLYCGNEYEVETYMVLCDFWKECIADSKWTTIVDSLSTIGIAQEEDSLDVQYEIWVLGYDLHTGDTICTPIAPSCIWIHKDDITYNVGSYTSLDSIVRLFPFNWKVPQYSLISCLEYNEEIQPTYHYEIHVLGYFAPFDYRPLPPPYYQA